MKSLSLEQIALWTEGKLEQGNPAQVIKRLHSDTRTLQAGDLFIALRGPRFDGHDFIPYLRDKGAEAALISAPVHEIADDLGLIRVADTLLGFQKFAENYRRSLPVRVVGVTGSSGKTSTKELISAVLRQQFKTQATEGNLNNHIGVPMTLTALDDSVAYAVVEMGMNHLGEIAPLAKMAAPQIGVISSIGPAHIEFFPDQAGIAHEKAELIRALPKEGVAVLNSDDRWSQVIAKETQARVVWVGSGAKSQWRASDVQITREGLSFQIEHGAEKALVSLPVFNRVMINNALLAAAVGHECGLSLAQIVTGLAAVTLPGARMKVLAKNGAFLINDAYNANPDSMRAALVALREFPDAQRRIAVLGSMGELGSHAAVLHQQVGSYAVQEGINLLITVGPNADALRQGALQAGAKPETILIALDVEEVAKVLKNHLQTGDVVLVKGSHFMGLDHLATLWQEEGIN